MARAGVTLVATALLVTGCATGPEMRPYERRVVLPEPAYAASLPPAAVEARWWEGFRDPVLDALVVRGLAANLDVTAAGDRLRRAAALLRAERSDRIPTADAAGEAGFALLTGGGITGTAGLFGFYDPDLTGRLGAEIRAAAANYAEADYLVADQRRLVAAAIANQYVEYRRTGAQSALLEESTDLQERTLRIVTLRFEAGLAANLDVRRAAADLAQTRARLGLIVISRANAANALAVLLSAPPSGFAVPPAPDPNVIPLYAGGLFAGVPADLLRRRTDVLAAEARLVNAAQVVGIEQADLRPRLTVPGDFAAGDGRLIGLFSNFLLTLGAAIDLPVFDGGRRRAEITAARAEADARFAEYRVVFLSAVGEVENALVAIDAYRQRDAALGEAIEQSETAFGQLNALYREGLTSLFDVLDGQRQLIASRQSLIDNEAALASAVIAFNAAVGSPGYERAAAGPPAPTVPTG